jgi:hypothetical protein
MADDYEIAKAGGKHAGLIDRNDGMPDHLVEKSIRSLENRIQIHKAKIHKAKMSTQSRNVPFSARLKCPLLGLSI